MVKKGARSGSNDNSFGIVGVVLGILSIVNLGMNGIFIGIIGLFFGLKQKKIGQNKWSKAGIILNIIGVVLGIIIIVLLFTVLQGYLAQLSGCKVWLKCLE